MNIFYFRKRVFIFILLFSIILIALQWLNRESKQDPLTLSSFKIFSEIQTASVNFQKGFSEVLKKYLFLLDIREKNQILERENNKLKIKQQLFEEIISENKKLKQIIEFPIRQDFKLLAGKVIGRDLLSKSQLLTINKGSLHGVRKKMGVLHPSGVVGYVFRASPHSSQIITLLHPLSSLLVRNRTSRETGLLRHSEKNRLLVNFLEQDLFEDQIQKSFKQGDALVTMESDQFPSGFLVGKVLPIHPSYKKINFGIYIQPFVDFSSLEEVFVVLELKSNLETERKNNETAQ